MMLRLNMVTNLVPPDQMPSKRLPAICRLLFAAAAVLTMAVLSSTALAQDTGGVKGKVRAMNGGGIGGATVTARKSGEDVKTTTADAKGNFVLDGLKPGKYNLVFDAPGYSSGVLYNVEIEARKVGDLGDRLMLSVDRGSLIILNGSVYFKEGMSLTGARIEVERVNSDGSTKMLANGYSNSTGEFTLRLPPNPGKLRVTAKYKGVSGSKEIDVDNPAIYRLAITLDVSRTEK
jgi:hypothetical protein